jgi:hypothetical protein
MEDDQGAAATELENAGLLRAAELSDAAVAKRIESLYRLNK